MATDYKKEKYYLDSSVKQRKIIDLVLSNFPDVYVTSTTRINAKPSSGHSVQKQSAVDFGSKGNLKYLYEAFILLQQIAPSYSSGLGILKANKHLHISDDNRHFQFLEIERPDKNGFVKIVSKYDDDYAKYLEIAKKEYMIPVKKDYKIPAIFAGIAFFFSRFFKKGNKELL
jgi:hypothetical protein